MARFRSVFPILYVADLPAAVRFYGDLLGMTENFRFPDEGEPAFVALDLGDGSQLALTAVSEATETLHGRPLWPDGGQRFELCIYVDDVDAAVDELRAAGVPVLHEAVTQPWNERMAYVADPDGNPVHIAMTLQG
jgi:lactoylglutathione lyase